MPQGRGYPPYQQNRQRKPTANNFVGNVNQPRRRSQFNYTSGLQNALTTGATLAPINPLLGLAGAGVGFYFGGKSGPFEPNASDYAPLRNAYNRSHQAALNDLNQGVNRIGQQSSQRQASQGLYGSPLGQSIVQHNQNYTLQSGLNQLNQNRFAFESQLGQQQLQDQRAYNQQMQSQWQGTLENLAFNALPIYNQYFRGNGEPSVGDLRSAAHKAGGLNQDPNYWTPVKSDPVQSAPAVTSAWDRTKDLRANPGTNQPSGDWRDPNWQGDGQHQWGTSAPPTPQPTTDDDEPISPALAARAKAIHDNVANSPELRGIAATDPEIAAEIEETFGDVFNFGSDLESKLDTGFNAWLERQQETEQQKSIPPQTPSAPPAPPAPEPEPAPDFNIGESPKPVKNPFLDQNTDVGSIYAPDYAMDYIKFGEGPRWKKPGPDPTSGYNIGWGRSITHRGFDVQGELIPMLRARYPTDSLIRSKLRFLGVNLNQTGSITLTPSQFNRLFPHGINEDMATMLLNNDISNSEQDLIAVLGEVAYSSLDAERQAVLLDMMHTLGRKRFSGFKRMIAALKQHNYYEAAREMRKSKWYNDVKARRANPLIRKMMGDDRYPPNFDQGVSSPQSRAGQYPYGIPNILASSLYGASNESDTSVGRFRQIEAQNRSEAAKAFRANKSSNFVRVADAVDDIYGRMTEEQKQAWGGVYAGSIRNMQDAGELTEQESGELLDYLEKRYPGRILPESEKWQEMALYTTTIPVATDNDVVNIAQKYLGYNEKQQKLEIKSLIEKNNIPIDINDTDISKFPWCASFASLVLKESGYDVPEGADQLRARKYINVGTASNGKVGDLMVFSGHVGIVAKVEANGDIWIVGGNQSDRISLKRIKYYEFAKTYGDSFIGFRTPSKRAK